MWDKEENTISYEEFSRKRIVKYWGAIDWGYSHHCALGIFATDDEGNTYLVEEHAHTKKNVDDYWVPLAQEMIDKYGNIMFYADSARPEHVDRFNEKGIRTIFAEKAVLAGISHMAHMIHNKTFKVVTGIPNTTNRFFEEVNMYCWKDGKDDVVKEWDDVLDMCRYALYTEYKLYSGREERQYGRR